MPAEETLARLAAVSKAPALLGGEGQLAAAAAALLSPELSIALLLCFCGALSKVAQLEVGEEEEPQTEDGSEGPPKSKMVVGESIEVAFFFFMPSPIAEVVGAAFQLENSELSLLSFRVDDDWWWWWWWPTLPLLLFPPLVGCMLQQSMSERRLDLSEKLASRGEGMALKASEKLADA